MVHIQWNRAITKDKNNISPQNEKDQEAKMTASLLSKNHTAGNKDVIPCKSNIKNKRSVPEKTDHLMNAQQRCHYLSGVPAQRLSKALPRNKAYLKKGMQDASKTCIMPWMTTCKNQPKKTHPVHKNKNRRSRLYNKAAGAVKTLHST